MSTEKKSLMDSPDKRRSRRFAALAASIALGIVWNFVPVLLMGGKATDAFRLYWFIPAVLVGLAAGLFTIRPRRRYHWKWSLLDGLITYYLGIVVYWVGFVVIERCMMCLQHGGWTDFNLSDHFKLILVFLYYGTIPYGLVLISLSFLSRFLVLKIYRRRNHE